ncbi:T-cell-interacting, activating receptor on myeloid cells protein 1-like [Myotis daubentonii]|uniref:T-cell-interacting, activating receptor on myeloid cells protein 1-like n=1 Tax=Myotis daubentonii TaxID=98922 RepID=UPI002872B057|nr:T-cell-interacting, activating receptor on myeloid cells protein 1-like [Myotis daubentonii]
MIHTLLPLLCLRLCAGQDLRRDGSLPRPSLRAWPSWMVPANSDVTLRCSMPAGEVDFRDIRFALRKNNVPLNVSPDSPSGLAEFHLSDIQTSDAGEYTCEYRTGSPTRRSLPSDVLLLLVTGALPKPSLQAHQKGEVTAGENLTLQCQQPSHVTKPHMFALLKKGTSTPIQLQGPVGMETDFSLPSVTGSDTGAYSCVYYQPRAPFYASEPSDDLTISVTDSPGATPTDYTSGNLIRLGLSALIMVLMVAFLVEAWWSQRRSPGGPGPASSTHRSASCPGVGRGDDEYLVQQDLLSLYSWKPTFPASPGQDAGFLLPVRFTGPDGRTERTHLTHVGGLDKYLKLQHLTG